MEVGTCQNAQLIQLWASASPLGWPGQFSGLSRRASIWSMELELCGAVGYEQRSLGNSVVGNSQTVDACTREQACRNASNDRERLSTSTRKAVMPGVAKKRS